MRYNKRRKRKSKRKASKTIPIEAVLAVSVIAIALIALLLLMAASRYRDVTGNPVVLSARFEENGVWLLEWTPFDAGGLYSVSVRQGRKTICRERCFHGESMELSTLTPGEYLILIQSGSGRWFEEKNIFAERVWLADLPPENISVSVEPDQKTAVIEWASSADCFTLYDLSENSRILLDNLASAEIKITFGDGQMLQIPEKGYSVILGCSAIRHSGACTVYEAVHELAAFSHDDLCGTSLFPTYSLDEKNRASFGWAETKGSKAEISVAVGGDYRAIYTGPIENTSFSTEPLSSCAEYTYRLRALEREGSVVSEKLITVQTGISALNASVWPLKELQVFATPKGTESVGKADALKLYCVLDEDDEAGMFLIRYSDNAYGWIDSNYCLINLPEYIGDLCSYDITNSYSSHMTIHEYGISGLTGTTVQGYETVQLKDGSFIVPLLYPSAKKLRTASEAALSMGCRLRIYDAYCPKKATDRMYSLTEYALYEPIPYRTYTGNTVSLPGVADNGRWQLMMIDFVNNNGLSLSSFLSLGGSSHNTGTGIDLCLEDAESGEILPAQTMIHDISIYSSTYSNNEPARALFNIMEAAGLEATVSMWWHFQDTETQNRLGLEYADAGVSIQGWIFDGIGWRYRDSSGDFIYENIPKSEKTHSFDANGYVIEETKK